MSIRALFPLFKERTNQVSTDRHHKDGVWTNLGRKLTVRTRLLFVLWNHGTLAEKVFQAGPVSSQGIIGWHKPVRSDFCYINMAGSERREHVYRKAESFTAAYLSLTNEYISRRSSMNFFHSGFSFCKSL